MLALVIILGHILSALQLTASNPTDGAAGLGAVFFLGLVASSSSCLSLVGGLLLSLSATWREYSEKQTAWRRLQPLLLFNGGRLLGFFLLGGLIGILGSALHPSPRVTAYLTVFIAGVMVLIGLHLLQILPPLPFKNPFSGRLANRLVRMTRSASAPLALLLGALTFFVPCGFTQSTQLLALSSGTFRSGALIMTVFALGTLPSLLGISVISSLAGGDFLRWFLRFSGVLVVVLGLLNLKGGLLLLNVDVTAFLPATLSQEQDPNVSIDQNGLQIITVTVTDQGYIPNVFTIKAGLSTMVHAIAPQNLGGCATFLLVPAYNLRTPILQGENWLGPIENPQSDFILTCSMGMLRADVHVVPN